MSSDAHPLTGLLQAAALGAPPVADFEVDVTRRAPGAVAAIVAFTGHIVVAAHVPRDWVYARCPAGDMVSPTRPDFMLALAERCGCSDFSNTVTFARADAGSEAPIALVRTRPRLTNPRVARSLRVRTDVRTYETEGGSGLVVIGRGLADRWEAGFEVVPEARGHGLGRQLARSAITLLPRGEPLFMQVVPGNIASLRAVLAAGFRPISAELLLW